jgi:hypothetical protein
MKGTAFADTMSNTELQAWNVFKGIVKKFLGNVKDPQCEKIWEIYYCWSIKREALHQEYKRKSSKQSFATNQKRKHSDPNYSI